MFEVKINFTEIKNELKLLKQTNVKKITADIAEKKMQKHLAAKAPRRTGKFSSSFKKKNTKDGVQLVTKFGDLFTWLEFSGTQAHVIVPRKAKVLHWIDPATGKDVFRMRVNHPGFKARPFARPGLDKTLPSAAGEAIGQISRKHKWIKQVS